MTSCTISVDVVGNVPGDHSNTTSALNSSEGSGGTASDKLTVNPALSFSKVFAPDTITAGNVTTLTFTIDNTAGTAAATALEFTDNLPAGVEVATPANASATCTGGTIAAVSGTGVISFTGGSQNFGAACTITADVVSNTAGVFINTSGDLTSTLGNSGDATDTLTVNPAPPAASIPTLSEWGRIIFALMIASSAVIYLKRSRDPA